LQVCIDSGIRKALEGRFANGALMMAYQVGKIADFSFLGLSQLLFREFTEIPEVAKGKPPGQVHGH
jgi:hypothetical protein